MLEQNPIVTAGSSNKGKASLGGNIRYPLISLRRFLPEAFDHRVPDIVHEKASCDGPLCLGKNEPINGPLYHCTKCSNIDFCSACVRSSENTHNVEHMLLETFDRTRFIYIVVPSADEHDMVQLCLPIGEPILNTDERFQNQSQEQSARDLPNEKDASTSENPSLNRPTSQVGVPVTYNIDENGAVTRTEFPPGIDFRDPGKKRNQSIYTPIFDDMFKHTTGQFIPYRYSLQQISDDAQAGIPSTRVIDLQPGKDDDRLNIEFRTIRLTAEAPPYEALSYTWKETTWERRKSEKFTEDLDKGMRMHPDIDIVHPVYIGEKEFVTINTGLRDALLNLRHQTEVRTLWVDQLCIDQNNGGERDYQVGNMLSVYHRAIRVVVWTGEHDRHTQVAFTIMEIIAQSFRDSAGKLPPTPEQVDNTELGLPPVGSQPWLSLLEFFERPVFSRMWVVQEIVLGSDVIIKCGNYEVEWWKVAAVVEMLGSFPWLYLPWRTRPLDTRKPEYVRYIDTIRKSIRGRPIKLSNLFLLTKEFQATDPRDRFFALLGILRVNRNAEMVERIPKANYSQSPEAVFIQAAKYIICEEQNLDLLGQGGSLNQLPTLPTWVFDCSATLGVKSFPFCAMSDNRPYKACGETSVMACPLDSQPKVLQTSSFIWSKVMAVGRPNRYSTGKGHETSQGIIMESWLACASQIGPRYPTDQKTVTAFLRTMLGDMNLLASAYPASQSYLKLLGLRIEDLILKDLGADQYNNVTRPQNSLLLNIHQKNSLLTKQDLDDAEFGNASSQMAMMKMNRRFFVTENQHFGLGPVDTEPGDEVHIISGCNTPMILRRAAKSDDNDLTCHHLLGESYVHGIMGGQACSQGTSEWNELFIQ